MIFIKWILLKNGVSIPLYLCRKRNAKMTEFDGYSGQVGGIKTGWMREREDVLYGLKHLFVSGAARDSKES